MLLDQGDGDRNLDTTTEDPNVKQVRTLKENMGRWVV